jgi:hypothetical protein
MSQNVPYYGDNLEVFRRHIKDGIADMGKRNRTSKVGGQ